jgi:hypothetical protein
MTAYFKYFKQIVDRAFGAMGQFNSSPPVLLDEQWAGLQLDESGHLLVSVTSGGGDSPNYTETVVHNCGDIGTYALGVKRVGLSPVCAGDGEYAGLSLSLSGALYTLVDPGAPPNYAEAAVHSYGAVGTYALAMVNQALGIARTGIADGDFSGLSTSLAGGLYTLPEPTFALTRTGGYEQPAETKSAAIVHDVSNTPMPITHSTAMLDGSAVRGASDTTVALTAAQSGVLTSGQIRRVLVLTGGACRVLEQGRNGVCFTYAAASPAGTITIAGAGAAPVPAGAVVEVGWCEANKVARTYGYESSATTTDALVVQDTAAAALDYTHSTARGDGIAVWASSTTITFTGPTIVSTQLRRVLVDTGSEVRVLENGKNGVRLSISAGVITVAGAGTGTNGPLTAGAVTVEVMWVQQNKAFDPASNSEQTFEVAPVNLTVVEDVLLSGTIAKNTITAGLGTLFYPSATGLDMTGFKDTEFEISLIGNVTGTPTDVMVTFEGSNDSAFTYPKDITPSGYELTTNAYGAASIVATGVAPTARVNRVVDFDNYNMKFIRVRGGASNGTGDSGTCQIIARRKAL